MTNVTLAASGDRTVLVDAQEADGFVDRWTNEIAAAGEDAVVTAVDLSDRAYLPEGAEVVCDFLQNHLETTTAVGIHDIIASLETKLGLATLERFTNLFTKAPVVSLDISDNAVGEQGLAVMRPIFMIPTLTHLYVKNNGMSKESMELITSALLTTNDEGQSVASQLQVFEVFNNMVGVEGAKIFADMLPHCTSLTELRYEGNRPYAEGMASILNGLLELTQTNHGITRLVLEDTVNNDPEGAFGILCQVLQNCPELKILGLMDSDFEHVGVCRLCKVLKGFKLEGLDLSINGINRHTVRRKLRPLLQDKRDSLRKLNLSGNTDLYSIGVAEIVQSFMEDNMIEELILSDCNIGTVGANAVLDANLPKIQALHLNDNYLTEEIVALLKEKFGAALQPMPENTFEDTIDEEDNSDLEEEEYEDEEDEEEESDEDEEVDELTEQFSQSQLY